MLQPDYLSFLKQIGLKPPYGVVGLGISGRATLALLKELKIPPAEIVSFDSQDPTADFKDADLFLSEKNPQTLFVSPGVPLALPWLKVFKEKGGRISSELELSFSFIKSEKVIGITGSIGKSTTTSLLGEGLRILDPEVFVGGNLGEPLGNYILNVLRGKPRAQFVVLELSSYQLENFQNLNVEVSIFTYLTANHLERYPGIRDYYDAKIFLAKRTTGLIVANKNGGDLVSVFRSNSLPTKIIWSGGEDLQSGRRPLMLGRHNLDNIALAAKVLEYFGASQTSFDSLYAYPGLAHRMENLGSFKQIQFVNDSKSTTIESVLQAVNSVSSQVKGSLVLLLGGKDKNLPWEDLQKLSAPCPIQFIYFGQYGSMAQKKAGHPGPVFEKLGDALKELPKIMKANDFVLLSPGGTSLDEFKSFEDRGNFFKTWVLLEMKND